MRGLFWIVALCGLAVAVALGARYNEGYVLVVFPPWRAEVSLNLFIIALLALFFVLYAGMRALAVTFGLPKRVREYRAQRQRESAGLVFQDAVRLLFEGRFGQALKKATEAHGAGTAPGLSALIAARAAQRMREPEKQQYWLEHAKTDDPRTEAATLMLDAEMANEARRFDVALAALEKLQGKQGRHIAALRLELRARQGVGDWDGVLKLARQLVKRDALPVEVVREIRTQAHLGNIAKRVADQGKLTAYLRTVPDDERGRRVVVDAGAHELQLTVEQQRRVATRAGGHLRPPDQQRADRPHCQGRGLVTPTSRRRTPAQGPGPHVHPPAAVGQGTKLSGGFAVGRAVAAGTPRTGTAVRPA